MFAIDLLKGRGIPIRSRPEGIAVAAATFAVPVIIAIVMLSFYLSNKVAVSIKRQEITSFQCNIDELSGALEIQRAFDNERNILINCLSETAGSLKRHIQWSPILLTMVKNMPDSMILTKLDAEQRSVRKKIPDKKNPERDIEVSIPARRLHITLGGSSPQNSDRAVRNFRDSLRFSNTIEPMLDDIPVSQEVNILEGREVVSYEISCIFKPLL